MDKLKDIIRRKKVKMKALFENPRNANFLNKKVWKEEGAVRAKEEVDTSNLNQYKLRAKGLEYKVKSDEAEDKLLGSMMYDLLPVNWEKTFVKNRETSDILLQAADIIEDEGYKAAKDYVESEATWRKDERRSLFK